MPRPITINVLTNGFVVQAGCFKLVFEDSMKLGGELMRWLRDPTGVEEEYARKYGVPLSAASAIGKLYASTEGAEAGAGMADMAVEREANSESVMHGHSRGHYPGTLNRNIGLQHQEPLRESLREPQPPTHKYPG